MGKHMRLPVQQGSDHLARLVRPKRSRTALRYFAFLSYSHKDEELAEWLHEELEGFHVPPELAGRLTDNGVIPKRLAPIFRDEHELAAASDLSVEIEQALGSSQYLIVLCSPEAAKSRWTNAEIELFKRTRPDGRVLAAIAGGEPFASEMPGREAEECFPPALRQKFDRRGRPTGKRAEPLAADLREQGDGRRLGMLRLVAGMLGVGLDDLVQRETTRRHRRLAWLTAASLAGMAVTSTLAFTAIRARDEARDQRREAEGLVEFMLGDLKEKLEPIGRLDALDGVGAKVLAYYSKQKAGDLTDEGLLQRSRALSLTAQVAYLRGDYAAAMRLYREAMAGTGEAVSRDNEDPQRLFDHAQNVFWLGELARLQGDLSKAEASYREYGRLAGRMTAIQPDNLKWRMEVQYARENLGIVLFGQRRFGEAAGQFESALKPMESLASVDPGNITYQLEVSNLMGWLADARRETGQFEQAMAVRQRQVSYLDRLLAGGATNVAIRDDLIPAHQALGVLWTWRGQPQRGVEEYRKALTTGNSLIAIEPNNSFWKAAAAGVQLELAKNLLALGHAGDAAREAAAGCQTVASLRAAESAVAKWRSLETSCLAVRARLALSTNDREQAVALAERTVSSAKLERSGDAVADRFSIASAYRLLGDAQRSAGNPDGAKAAWSAGLQRIPANVSERPWELSERASLLRRLGRSAEADPMTDRLQRMGFRNLT